MRTSLYLRVIIDERGLSEVEIKDIMENTLKLYYLMNRSVITIRKIYVLKGQKCKCCKQSMDQF